MADDFNIDLSGVDLGGVDIDPFASPDPNTLGASFDRGVDNMQRNLYSMAWEAGNAVDDERLKDWGYAGMASNSEDMYKNGAPMRFSEAEGLSEYASVFVNTLAQAAPNLVGAGASGVASTLATGTPIPGMAAYMGAQNLGEMSNRERQLQGDNYEGLGIAEIGVASAMTFIDTASAGFMAKPFQKSLMKQYIKDFGEKEAIEQLSKGLIKGGVRAEVARGMAQASVVEGVASLMSEGMLEAGANALSGTEIDSDDFMERMKETAIMSFSLGGVMGGAGGYSNFHTKARMIDPSLQRIDPVFRVINDGIDAVSSKVDDSALGRTWNTIAGDVTAPMKSTLSKVPAGKKILNLFKGTEDLEQAHRDLKADHQMKMADSLDNAQKFYGKKDWKKQLGDDLEAGIVNDATTPLRALLDEHFASSVGRKMVSEKQKIEGYLPSNMDTSHISKNWGKFVEELEAEYQAKGKKLNKDTVAQYKEAVDKGDFSTFQDKITKLSEEDLADNAARRLTDEKLSEDALGRRKTGRVGSQMGNVEGQRAFTHASQQFYNRWSKGENKGVALVDSIEGYGKKLAHRFAAVDKIGAQGEHLNRLINQAQEEMVTQHGEKIPAQMIERMYQTVDAYQGTHGRIQDPFWNTTRNVVSAASNWATLPLVTLSSFVEILNVAAKTDMSTMVRATARVSGMFGANIARQTAGRGPTGSYKTNGTQMHMAGQTFREATNTIAARIGDETASARSAKWNNRLFKWNGLTAWTQAVRNVSSEAMRMVLREDLDTVNRIPDTFEGKQAAQRIKEVGLTPEDVQFMNNPHTLEADIIRANELYGKAINRFNRTVSLEPSFADRPLWMSDQKMWALSRLAGYPTMFTNTILPMLGRRLRETPNTVLEGLFIVGAQATLGVAQQAMRDTVAGRDFGDREINEALMDSFVRNSAPRPLQIPYDAAKGARYGRSAAVTAMGPVIGTSSELLKQFYRMTAGTIDAGEFLEQTLYRTTALGAFKKHWK